MYGGAGPAHEFARLDNNTNYSNVGVVVELSNRWTKLYELFVLEATENSSGAVDPFSDTVSPGLKLFPLEERLYSFHGSAIWWLPQSKALEEAGADILHRWALTAHESGHERPFPAPDPKNIELIGWKTLDLGSERTKMLGQFYNEKSTLKHDDPVLYPLHGPQLVGHVLSAIGIVDSSTTDVAAWTIDTVLNHAAFNLTGRTLLRVTKELHSFVTRGDTDENAKLDQAQIFQPYSSFCDLSHRIPSSKTFSHQHKQIQSLQEAISHQMTPQEANLLNAASNELLRAKKHKGSESKNTQQ